MIAIAAVLAIFFALTPSQPAFCEGPALAFSPPQWEFGTIPAGSRAFLTLRVANRADRKVTVSVIPMCDCLSTGPSRQVIAPGSRAEFRFSILAEEDESGDVRESYIVQTDLPGLDHFYYQVHGTVKPKRQP